MQRRLYWLLLAVFLLTTTSLSLSPLVKHAQAAADISSDNVKSATLSWTNQAYIQAQVGPRTLTFFDQDINDETHEYKVQSYDCPGKLTLERDKNGVVRHDVAKIDLDIIPAGTQGVPCQNVGSSGQSFERLVGHQENAQIEYSQSSSNPQIIQRVDNNKDWVFKQGNGSVYLRTAEDGNSCQDRILLTGANSYRMYELQSGSDSPRQVSADTAQAIGIGSEKCWYSPHISSGVPSDKDLVLGNVATNTASPDTPNSTGSGGTDEAPTCETVGGNPASWILCPIINGMSGAADWVLENFIQPFLENVPLNTDTSSPSFNAWSGFRIIANIMLVGLLLLAVISQAISKE